MKIQYFLSRTGVKSVVQSIPFMALAVPMAVGAAALFFPTVVSAGSVESHPPTNAVDDVAKPLPAGAVTIGGWLGDRMDICMKNRVMAQRIDRIAQPFVRRDNDSWASEYWGKWYGSVAYGYHYQPTKEHRAKLDQAVDALLKTQTPDGQINGYDAAHQFGVNWDLWGREYALLGLIMNYDETGDKRSLQAAEKAADAIVRKVNDGMVIGERCLGLFKGVQSTAILAEFAMLYTRTGDKRYLDVAELIVKQFDIPNKIAPEGLRLVTDALADKPPVEVGDTKCYEVLANYEGLLELYRATGDKKLLKAVSMYLNNVLKYERMIHGSMSNNELWFNGVKNQTGVLEQPVETCATTQWMLICWQVLRLTDDPKWADELERSLYNALLGSMMPDGRWWSYFAHLNGERIPAITQHADIPLTCCVSYGPKGLLLTPQWAVMKTRDGINVNLYAPGSARVRLDNGVRVAVLQKTSYPETATVTLTIEPEQKTAFTLRLRIPSWSRRSKLSVNGQQMACTPGEYAEIHRTWSRRDIVQLELDMRVRAIEARSGAPQLALARGPVLLALDSRLVKPSDRAVYIQKDKDGYVQAKKITPDSSDIWMEFEVPVYTSMGPVNPPQAEFNLAFCDYPSAGNRWDTSNQFRTWLPQPLYLRTAFYPDTWKLAYGGHRPTVPAELRVKRDIHRENKRPQIEGKEPVYESRFLNKDQAQTVIFKKPVQGQYFGIKTLSDYRSNGFAAISEIKLLDADGNPLLTANATLAYVSSEEETGEDGIAENAIDGRTSDYWHSEWKHNQPGHPHVLIINLGNEATVGGFVYVPRAGDNPNGRIKDYQVYVGNDLVR